MDQLDEFYDNQDKKESNRTLLATKQRGRVFINPTREETVALERKASFLTIKDPLESLNGAVQEVIDKDDPSTSLLAVNSIVTAVKSQIETLNDVALKQAWDGQRICPMTLHPLKFGDFLEQNAVVLQQLVRDCRLPIALRGPAVTQHLGNLANSYFSLSSGYDGAPQSRPHKIELRMGAQSQSQAKHSLFGTKTVCLSIDSDGLDAFCSRPLPPLEQCGDFQDVFRSHLMTGFEDHPMDKKLAAMYMQLMLHEVSEVQETMGSKSAFKSAHGPAARNAGAHTLEEMHYEGSQTVGDQTGRNGSAASQRARAAQIMALLPFADAGYHSKHGISLITDGSLRRWVHSAAFHMDLRTLTEPSARLLLQRAPMNAQSLLRTPALFSSAV